jgi:crossover junction endodeoxyribonuclease RuvC
VPEIVGLDLSLTSTGAARIGPAGSWTTRFCPPKGLDSWPRLSWILEHVEDVVRDSGLVVIEGPSYGSGSGVRQAGHHERGGLWWLVTHSLWLDSRPVAVVPPASLKRYITGKGTAHKDAVLAATIRRYPDIDLDGNDQADALVLAAMGADHLGYPIAPMPATHRAALDTISWPETGATP